MTLLSYHCRNQVWWSKVRARLKSLLWMLWTLIPFTTLAEDTMEIYYINLKSSVDRDIMIRRHLSHFNYPYFRVDAVTVGSNKYVNLTSAHHPCELPTEPLIFNTSFSTFERIRVNKLCVAKRNTIKEIAVTLSHVKAVYTAITSNNSYPYAMIMEDDLQIQFDVDFDALIRLFPPDFGIIQTFVINFRAGKCLSLFPCRNLIMIDSQHQVYCDILNAGSLTIHIGDHCIGVQVCINFNEQRLR